MTSPRLNFAGFLAKHCITSKLTPVFIIVVALMGAMAVLQTPREENPQIVVPAAAVVVVVYIVVPWASNRWLHRHEVQQEEIS